MTPRALKGALGRTAPPLAADEFSPDAWLIDTIAGVLRPDAGQWQVTPAEDEVQPWISAIPVGAILPAQGWKLHVSSYPSTAEETLRRVLPVLSALGAPFKVVGSIRWLSRLNRGAAGVSQVGKFMTVFPSDDAFAVEVAAALAEATRGLRGPAIPSDRPVTEDGVVFYRFGGFGEVRMQTRLGEVVLALSDPDGRLVPDSRGQRPVEPSWVTNPFTARGLTAPAAATRAVAGRYRPISTLARSAATVVQLGLDIREPRACVLKRARLRHATDDVEPDDGWVRVRREAAVLAALSGLGVAPAVYDVVQTGTELVLVTQDLGGQTLDRWMLPLTASGALPASRTVAALGAGLADALALVHARSFVHGDLKSGNVVITADEQPRLVDFELGYPIGSARATGRCRHARLRLAAVPRRGPSDGRRRHLRFRWSALLPAHVRQSRPGRRSTTGCWNGRSWT